MDLRAYLAILRKHLGVIVSAVVLSVAAASGLILLTEPTYKAHAQIFVSTQISSGNLNQELFQGSNFSTDRVKSYSKLVTSPTVLDPVIEELSLPVSAADLAPRVSAEVPLETVLIDISATADSPETAAALANSVSNSLTDVIGELESSETRGSSPVKATVVTPAVAPSSPSWPSIPLNLGVGLLAGLFVGVGIAVLLEKLNTSVKDADDIATLCDVPVLAAIAHDSSRGAGAIVPAGDHGARGEAFRQLRTNLQFAAVDQIPKVIVVTSAVAGEGKSSVAGNLAAALARVGTRVCLLDGDLRRPSVAKYFHLNDGVGLSEALVGQAGVEEILQPVHQGLTALSSGTIPPNPAELLSSQRFPPLLAELKERFDIIVVDAPPILPAADAAVLAAHADAVVLVVHAGKTTQNQFDRALGSLGQVRARVLGVVLNMVPARALGKSRYWYAPGSYTTPAKNGAPAGGHKIVSHNGSHALAEPIVNGKQPVRVAGGPTTNNHHNRHDNRHDNRHED
ncbi:polysaccharide biosynthesis tyrosine autokinase [Mycobacterium sp. LTG2003]